MSSISSSSAPSTSLHSRSHFFFFKIYRTALFQIYIEVLLLPDILTFHPSFGYLDWFTLARCNHQSWFFCWSIRTLLLVLPNTIFSLSCVCLSSWIFLSTYFISCAWIPCFRVYVKFQVSELRVKVDTYILLWLLWFSLSVYKLQWLLELHCRFVSFCILSSIIFLYPSAIVFCVPRR